jgi:hypothetical protein
MRRYLIQQFGKGNWMLQVDVDEFFDYPASDRVSLPSLTRYLNHYGYTVLLVHMLDLFPEATIAWQMEASPSLSEPGPEEAFREQHRLYDISALNPQPYTFSNIVTNPAVRLYRGGLRGELFGTKGFPLFKHSLFLPGSGVAFRHEHLMEGGRLADFTGVLYHYKFTARFQARVLDAVQQRQYFNESSVYAQYLRTLNQGALPLNRTSIVRLNGVQDLVENGFLVVSEQYWQFAEGLTGN